MTQLRLLLFLLCSTVLGFSALELTEGITRAELEKLVGKPISVLQRGEKTVLIYPNRGRAELVAGRLVYFERIEALDTPAAPPAAAVSATPVPAAAPAASAAGASVPGTKPAPAPSASPTPPSAAKAKAPAAAVAGQPATQPGPAAKPVAAPAPATGAVGAAAKKASPGGAAVLPPEEEDPYARLSPEERQRLEKHDAEMARMQEKFLNGEPLTQPKEDPLASSNPWVVMLLQALLSIPVTVVVLKYSFKWCDVDADWSQMWLPALVDTLVRGTVQAAAEALWGIDTLFYVDEGLAFFALLFVLIKTTHACTAARAIGVAFAAKFVGIVVWAILSVFILGLLFSRANS
jgi:hypothetical protein